MAFVAAVLTVSDIASTDASLDKSGPLLRELLEKENEGSTFKVLHTQIVPDERDEIANVVRKWTSLDEVDWIITSGGTGFGRRDRTPEVWFMGMSTGSQVAQANY
jgi:gephyrin